MRGRTRIPLAICAAVALSAGLWAGCYSFTGASVPPHLKTIAVPLVDDQSGLGEPGLREQFTRTLTNLFISDNSLQVVEKTAADAVLEGVITSVTDAPSVVQEGEQVRSRRVTMTVRFTMQDMKLRKKMWEKSFSDWGEYPSGAGASQRRVGIDAALQKITEDILLETVSGW